MSAANDLIAAWLAFPRERDDRTLLGLLLMFRPAERGSDAYSLLLLNEDNGEVDEHTHAVVGSWDRMTRHFPSEVVALEVVSQLLAGPGMLPYRLIELHRNATPLSDFVKRIEDAGGITLRRAS